MKFLILLSLSFILNACTTGFKRHPSSSNIVFPSNINKAKEIYFFGNLSNASTVGEFIKSLEKINKLEGQDLIKARFFIELPTNFDSGVIADPKKTLETLGLNQLGLSYRSKDLPQSNKHVIFYVDQEFQLGPSLWLQDFGQLYYQNDKITFLDLSYGYLENTSEFHRYIESPKGLSGIINKDYKGERTEKTLNTTLEGGDVEVLPNGVILTGNLIHPELKKYLQKDLNQQLLQVPADFMATGHVDEVFSIIPVPKELSNGCGYALAHIDPIYGLRLALDKALKHKQTQNRQAFIDAISYFTNKDGETMINKDNFAQIPEIFKFDKQLKMEEQPWGISPSVEQWYVYRAVSIHKSVQVGIQQIRDSLKSSCNNLKTVGLPVIFSDYAAGESTLDKLPIEEGMSDKDISNIFKKAPVNMHYSPINMIVANKHLLIPSVQDLSAAQWDNDFSSSFLETYKWIIEARLKPFGFEVSQLHFINSNVFVYNGGSLHCGSMVSRSKNERVY